MDWRTQEVWEESKKQRTAQKKQKENKDDKFIGLDRDVRFQRTHISAQNMEKAVVQLVPDPIKADLYERNDTKESVTQDVNRAMFELRRAIINNAEMVDNLQRTGRDAWVYAGFFSRNDSLYNILLRWGDSWTLENTCGLLLDLGLALRRNCNRADILFRGIHPGSQRAPIMNDMLNAGRINGRYDRNSEWARNFVPTGSELQSGPSATTGQLLRLLFHFKEELELGMDQIEAIMIGAVEYWDHGSTIKWILGKYHTAVEVWAVYNYYLEEIFSLDR